MKRGNVDKVNEICANIDYIESSIESLNNIKKKSEICYTVEINFNYPNASDINQKVSIDSTNAPDELLILINKLLQLKINKVNELTKKLENL